MTTDEETNPDTIENLRWLKRCGSTFEWMESEALAEKAENATRKSQRKPKVGEDGDKGKGPSGLYGYRDRKNPDVWHTSVFQPTKPP